MQRFFMGALLLLSISTATHAQLLKDITKKMNLDKAIPVDNILKKPSAISTAFSDVNMQGSLDESFGNDKKYKPLYQLKRSESGGFLLEPGYYEMTNKSYCLKAGTHGPSQGDGYMFAPTKGPREEIVNHILLNSAKRSEIPQQDVQVLLWAIIAKSKFKDMSGRLKLTATSLLTPKQILELNGGAIGTVSDEALKRNIIDMPPAVQKVMEAENKIRNLVASGSDRYEDYERWAVLAGAAPNDRPDVKRGRWTLHPDGYYVRYFPEGYPRTKVQVYVPEKLSSTNLVYDAVGDIACPASTGSQRLAQTNQPVEQ